MEARILAFENWRCGFALVCDSLQLRGWSWHSRPRRVESVVLSHTYAGERPAGALDLSPRGVASDPPCPQLAGALRALTR
jgi:hypothetical protein